MSPHGNVTPISERVRLVIALTQVNSDHLRGESRLAGAEIELEGALADCRAKGETPQATRHIALLRERLDDAQRSLRAREDERQQLEAALANLDAAERSAQDRDTR